MGSFCFTQCDPIQTCSPATSARVTSGCKCGSVFRANCTCAPARRSLAVVLSHRHLSFFTARLLVTCVQRHTRVILLCIVIHLEDRFSILCRYKHIHVHTCGFGAKRSGATAAQATEGSGSGNRNRRGHDAPSLFAHIAAAWPFNGLSLFGSADNESSNAAYS